MPTKSSFHHDARMSASLTALRCQIESSAPGELRLHALIETRDVDDQPGVRAVTDQVFFIMRLDTEFQRAPIHRHESGGRPHAHPDRRRRDVTDVEPRAETLVSGRDQIL